MTNVAQPFADILHNILKPREYQLPVAVDATIQPQTRFHPDDVQMALGVLATYYGAPQTLEDWSRLDDAFARCMVALDAAITRREERELNAQYRYEQARKRNPRVDVLQVLYDVREELDDREDTKDGDSGEPMPNWAMRLNYHVNEAIRAMGGK